ncbi:MAG: oligosaccharide flippase family protein [Chloroflexi bacterium]|nr:oligosaccharide flippase family protein [Chloroflexota bacterium]
MSLFQKITSGWREDHLIQRVVGSSSVLFSSNTISLGLSVLQGILAARLLTPAGFGLVGIIMSYASTVNGLLSFRMSELVVRYGGEYLEKDEKDKAAALVKAASLTEAMVSLLAFVLVTVTAGLASRYIAKTPDIAWLFIVYSLGLLANFNTETSTGILQAVGKIKLQGVINLAQSILTAGLITFAFFAKESLQFVLYAYLAGKLVLGLGMFFTAMHHLTLRLGGGWWKTSLRVLPNFREKVRFAVSSNLSATAILVFRESEILWVGFFLTNEAAGYYKAAYAIILLLALPVHPLILTAYPEFNRLIVQKAWPRLRDFLRKVTTIAFAYNFILGLGMILFGQWLLWLNGSKFVAAYPALMALLVGMVFNFTLFWNRPLLLSLGLPTFPLTATVIAGVLKVGLAFLLVPRYGYVMEAALLSFYYIFSVGLMVWRGMTEIRRRQAEI